MCDSLYLYILFVLLFSLAIHYSKETAICVLTTSESKVIIWPVKYFVYLKMPGGCCNCRSF